MPFRLPPADLTEVRKSEWQDRSRPKQLARQKQSMKVESSKMLCYHRALWYVGYAALRSSEWMPDSSLTRRIIFREDLILCETDPFCPRSFSFNCWLRMYSSVRSACVRYNFCRWLCTFGLVLVCLCISLADVSLLNFVLPSVAVYGLWRDE